MVVVVRVRYERLGTEETKIVREREREREVEGVDGFDIDCSRDEE